MPDTALPQNPSRAGRRALAGALAVVTSFTAAVCSGASGTGDAVLDAGQRSAAPVGA